MLNCRMSWITLIRKATARYTTANTAKPDTHQCTCEPSPCTPATSICASTATPASRANLALKRRRRISQMPGRRMNKSAIVSNSLAIQSAI